jgi:hypothetical protein
LLGGREGEREGEASVPMGRVVMAARRVGAMENGEPDQQGVQRRRARRRRRWERPAARRTKIWSSRRVQIISKAVGNPCHATAGRKGREREQERHERGTELDLTTR